MEHLIQTIEKKSLIQKCISKSWSLQEFLTEAGQIEYISLQMRDMTIGSDEKEVAKIEQPSRRRETTYGRSEYGGRRYNLQFCM